jgi:hypothetical protein
MSAAVQAARICKESDLLDMSSENPRNRLVVFRVTQDELVSLKAACAEKGGRNLSDFTRSELFTFLHSQSPEFLIQRKLDDIERQLSRMHMDIREQQHCSLAAASSRRSELHSDVAGPDHHLNFAVRSER